MDRGKAGFITAFVCLCITSAWLTINLVWFLGGNSARELILPALLFLAGAALMYREARRARRSK
ncbi:MAG: hypothetical protein J1D86_04750 [Alistipes sp.]|nr:hypothetical protein [Alistipes sp.]